MFVCVYVWQVHSKKLANNKKLYLAYAMNSAGYICYTRLFPPCILPPDLTENRVVNELCNLLEVPTWCGRSEKRSAVPQGVF